jgi:hypothetical protein
MIDYMKCKVKRKIKGSSRAAEKEKTDEGR